VQLGALPAFISSITSLATIVPGNTNSTPEAIAEMSNELNGSNAFLLCICALVIIIEILIIVVRVLNIGLVNLKIKPFLIIVSRLSH